MVPISGEAERERTSDESGRASDENLYRASLSDADTASPTLIAFAMIVKV